MPIIIALNEREAQGVLRETESLAGPFMYGMRATIYRGLEICAKCGIRQMSHQGYWDVIHPKSVGHAFVRPTS